MDILDKQVAPAAHVPKEPGWVLGILSQAVHKTSPPTVHSQMERQGFMNERRSTKLNRRRFARYCFIPFHSLNSRRLTSLSISFPFQCVSLQFLRLHRHMYVCNYFAYLTYSLSWLSDDDTPWVPCQSFAQLVAIATQNNPVSACYGKGVQRDQGV